MNESLFSRLFHYSKTDNRTPQEDYLTELLAWMIDNLAQFGQDYVTFLCSNSNSKIQQKEKCSVNAETQVVVSEGRIDMVITVDSSMCFVCEHKVDSSLAIDQITKYKHCIEEIKERYHVENVYYVFLSKIADKLEKEQKPDITIRWHEIYNYFNGKKFDNNSFETLMVKQFLEYLTEVGMGKKESISVKGVEYYSEAMKLERLLKVIFNDLSTDGDWESSCEGINQFLTDYNKPKLLEKPGEGRIGIEFTSTWQPGLFAGVKLHNNDHSLDKPHYIPQLVVTLDCYEGERSKHQEKPWFQLIMQNEKSISKSRFQIQIGAKKNQYRLLLLYKPLTEVLSQCKDDYDKQKDTIKKELIYGINWILNYYNLSCKDT